jgi:hypothetical protein
MDQVPADQQLIDHSDQEQSFQGQMSIYPIPVSVDQVMHSQESVSIQQSPPDQMTVDPALEPQPVSSALNGNATETSMWQLAKDLLNFKFS